MTAFTTLLNSLFLPGKRILGATGMALRDNVAATAEGASGAPVLSSGWHPYNKVTVGDSATGIIYDFAIDGAVASVITPTLVDGYDYMIHWSGISANVGAALRFNGVNCTVAGAAGDAHTGYLEILMPTRTNWPKTGFVNTRITGGSTGVATLNSAAATPFVGHFNFSAMAAALTSIDLSWSSGSFDAGQVFLYRRRNYVVA